MNDNSSDIFGEVAETEAPQTQVDPTTQLYRFPENLVEWFLAKKAFVAPKDVKDCTASLVVRFVSWQIGASNQAIYMGSGISTPGTLRNQLVSRYHQIPDGFGDGTLSGRVPCKLQFGESCEWCAEKTKADKRFPRDSQPANYFKDVIAKFKAKDKTLMLGYIWAQGDDGKWATDGKLRAFEFSNYLKTGRPFVQILNDRANDADKRIRIDKKTYAGYVNPVAIKITYSWPVKNGKPDKDKFAGWTPTDATPFPAEAGGPNLLPINKEEAIALAKHDPADWVNKDAFAGKVTAAEVGQWVYDVFTGKVSLAPKVDLDTADFGQLLEIVEKNKAKFPDLDVTQFSYDMAEALRAIVKGVLNG